MIVWAGGAHRALVAAAGLFLFFSVSALGSDSALGSGVWMTGSSAREARAFWTPARMQAAKPLEVGRRENRGGGQGSKGDRGKPRRIAPVAARPGEFGEDFVEVGDPTAPGFRVHGAIFVDLFFGYGRCSGTAVRAPNRSVVFTAGHCIHSGSRYGRWYRTRAAFIPAYRFGQRPFGIFPVRWVDTAKGWRDSGSENFDVGAMVVGKNEAGETLGEAVGGAGIAWNLKPKQTFDVHGYPAEPPFDGETQRLCASTRFLGHDPSSFVEPGPLNLGVTCQLNGGASGGGWMIEGGETLNGVTDYGYFDEASPAYGPYFGKEVARLYGRAGAVR